MRYGVPAALVLLGIERGVTPFGGRVFPLGFLAFVIGRGAGDRTRKNHEVVALAPANVPAGIEACLKASDGGEAWPLATPADHGMRGAPRFNHGPTPRSRSARFLLVMQR